MAQSTIESKNKKEVNNGKVPAKETILSPRFYTTDFEAMENMDLSIFLIGLIVISLLHLFCIIFL